MKPVSYLMITAVSLVISCSSNPSSLHQQSQGETSGEGEEFLRMHERLEATQENARKLLEMTYAEVGKKTNKYVEDGHFLYRVALFPAERVDDFMLLNILSQYSITAFHRKVIFADEKVRILVNVRREETPHNVLSPEFSLVKEDGLLMTAAELRDRFEQTIADSLKESMLFTFIGSTRDSLKAMRNVRKEAQKFNGDEEVVEKSIQTLLNWQYREAMSEYISPLHSSRLKDRWQGLVLQMKVEYYGSINNSPRTCQRCSEVQRWLVDYLDEIENAAVEKGDLYEETTVYEDLISRD